MLLLGPLLAGCSTDHELDCVRVTKRNIAEKKQFSSKTLSFIQPLQIAACHHSSFTASQHKNKALKLQFLDQIENLCSKTQRLRLQQLRQPLPGNPVVKEEKRQKTFGPNTDMGLIK